VAGTARSQGCSSSAGTAQVSRPRTLMVADSASGGTGTRSRLLMRMKVASHTTAPSTNAWPSSAPLPAPRTALRASGSDMASTPRVANAVLSKSARVGRSPSASTANSAATAGSVPATTPASAAGAWRVPSISSTV